MDDLSPAELREVKKAIKAAYERGRAAERREFDAFLARMRALKELNGSGDAFLKAYSDREPTREEGRRPDPHAAVAEAMLAHAEESMAAGDDHLPGVEALRNLLDDPAELGRVLAEGGADDESVGKAVWAVLKAWDESKHPRGKGGHFISRDRIEAAKTDPKLAKQLKQEVKPEDAGKLDAALEGKVDLGRTKRGEAKHQAGQRRATREEAKAKTAKFLGHLKRVGDLKAELTADDLHDLADHLGSEHVTLDDVRAMRHALAGAGAGRASFGGAKAKADMVKALQAHAKKAAFEARMKEHGIGGDAAEDMRSAVGLGAKEEAPASEPAARGPVPTGGQYGAWGRAAAGEATAPEPESAEPAPEVTPASPEPVAEVGKDPHEMTRAEFDATTHTHGAKKQAADAIAREGFKRGEFAPPGQRARGVDYGWDRAGLNWGDVQKIKAGGVVPVSRHGVVYFARKPAGGEKADTPSGLKIIGQLPYSRAAEDPHKAFVADALAAGKPVPPEVLADYPDLAPPPAAGAAPTPAPEPAAETTTPQPDNSSGPPAAGERKKVEYVRAPAGGQVSDVDGKFYRGGQLMPVHGRYSGMEKPPPGSGVGTAAPVQASEDGEGGGGGRGRGPQLTPEERRERAENQRKWDEMNAGPLGKLTWLGTTPNSKAFDPKNQGVRLDRWREFAERVGPEGVKRVISALEPEFHGAVEGSFRALRDENTRKKESGEWNPAYHSDIAPDAEEWEKNQTKVRAGEAVNMMRGGKGHEKKVPNSHYARELVAEMMRSDNNSGRSMVDAYHRLNGILASANQPAPDLAPPPAADATPTPAPGNSPT